MPSVNEAQEVWHELQEALDDVREKGEEAEEFAESVEDKGLDIMATVERTDRCTDGQYQALKNMLNGAMRWL
jgi:hypothetical protein